MPPMPNMGISLFQKLLSSIMSELINISYSALRQKIESKEITAFDVMKAYLDQMQKTEGLNAFVSSCKESALKQAEAADQRFQKGEARPLEGMPLAIKDNFCTKDIRTTAGSKMLENFVPTYTATVVQKLVDAGAIVVGKTNMDEFAMGSSTTTSAFGPTINPWKAKDRLDDLIPGGSSGGSSASVAAGSSLGALGSDTGGSIRQPAALCGVVGVKPTYGLCSRYGMIAFASSLDQAGPLARTVEDTALILREMAGHDPKDSTSLQYEVPDYVKSLGKSIKGMKVGIPKEYRAEGLNEEINHWWDQTIAWLKEAGAEVVDVSLPHTKYGLPTYYIIAPAEASSNLARYDGVRYGLRKEGGTLDDLYSNTRTNGFGDEVKRRILIGTYVLSAGKYEDYYLRAQRVRQCVTNDFKEVYQKVDVILTPTTANTAFKIGENITDPIAMYLQDIFTVTTNLAGLPGISVPVGLSKEGLPIGMQVIGPALQEEKLFQFAHVIEQSANFQTNGGFSK
jgi:aspartyl-tRNA(Asn)/glutamyl-tRNA(Gln) amidotransferase subunit A